MRRSVVTHTMVAVLFLGTVVMISSSCAFVDGDRSEVILVDGSGLDPVETVLMYGSVLAEVHDIENSHGHVFIAEVYDDKWEPDFHKAIIEAMGSVTFLSLKDIKKMQPDDMHFADGSGHVPDEQFVDNMLSYFESSGLYELAAELSTVTEFRSVVPELQPFTLLTDMFCFEPVHQDRRDDDEESDDPVSFEDEQEESAPEVFHVIGPFIPATTIVDPVPCFPFTGPILRGPRSDP